MKNKPKNMIQIEPHLEVQQQAVKAFQGLLVSTGVVEDYLVKRVIPRYGEQRVLSLADLDMLPQAAKFELIQRILISYYQDMVIVLEQLMREPETQQILESPEEFLKSTRNEGEAMIDPYAFESVYLVLREIKENTPEDELFNLTKEYFQGYLAEQNADPGQVSVLFTELDNLPDDMDIFDLPKVIDLKSVTDEQVKRVANKLYTPLDQVPTTLSSETPQE